MAKVALCNRRNVICGFAQSDRIVVAATAGAKDFCMIHGKRIPVSAHGMTLVAAFRCGDMSTGFAGGVSVVVTAYTGSPFYHSMVKRRVNESNCIVAGVALFRCWNVRIGFSLDVDIVMTSAANRCGFIVVKVFNG